MSRIIGVLIPVIVGITACTEPPPTPNPTLWVKAGPSSTSIHVKGSAVDGPISEAYVVAYRFDAGFRGEQVTWSMTDQNGNFTELHLEPDLAPYIVEVTATQQSIDLSTGEYPRLNALKTVITRTQLVDGSRPDFYITPLTTVATNIAQDKAKQDTLDNQALGLPPADVSQFLRYLSQATETTAISLGFGVDAEFDVFTTPPIITRETSVASLPGVVSYRAAIENLLSVLTAADGTGGDANEQALLLALATDLADGVVDTQIAQALAAEPRVERSQVISQLSSDVESTQVSNPVVLTTEGDLQFDAAVVVQKVTILPGVPDLEQTQASWGDFNWDDGSRWH